ncbi:hypothetical protein EPN95_03145 [Patescibacteria group bacterium]|nr:MAG: hypothetical protein EPN95_03145 [Patescibacteria group bacterium]
MEPETSAPKFGPEQTPIKYGPERVPQPVQPERGLLETGAERTEQVAETAAKASDTSGTVVTAPTTVVGDDDSTAQDPTLLASPAVAGDDDLIEKEWVDRAKKIIADTRNDPFQQENAVTELQKDYQKKRYGRELGEAS